MTAPSEVVYGALAQHNDGHCAWRERLCHLPVSACGRPAAGHNCNHAPLQVRFLAHVCGVHGLVPAAMMHAASTVTGAWKVNMFNPKARFFGARAALRAFHM
jgi:hypothetical protein